MTIHRFALCLTAGVIGCGAPTPLVEPATTPVPVPVASTPALPEPAVFVSDAPDTDPIVPASGVFAPSPLTPLADEMLLLAEAALAGRVLPPHRIDIERMKNEVPNIAYKDDSDRPSGLTFIAFGMEIDVVFGGVADSELDSFFS